MSPGTGKRHVCPSPPATGFLFFLTRFAGEVQEIVLTSGVAESDNLAMNAVADRLCKNLVKRVRRLKST
ncbi:MAG TPA: hypothetical protein VEG32_00035 [Clostridia bacterium]|nr:hypothetical protein [Clostridia bacterium]